MGKRLENPGEMGEILKWEEMEPIRQFLEAIECEEIEELETSIAAKLLNPFILKITSRCPISKILSPFNSIFENLKKSIKK